MKFFHSIFFAVILLVVIFFVGFSLIKLWPDRLAVNKEVENLDKKIEEIEKSNLELAESLEYFKSDSYREREARLRLNYKNPDEKAAFVYREKENFKISEDILEIESDMPNFLKWWRWLWIRK